MFFSLFGLFKKEPQKIVEIESIKPQNFIQTVRVIGVVHAYNKSDLYAKSPGILDHIFTPSGFVKKGSKIASLKNSAQVESLQGLQTSEDLEKKQYERAKDMHKKGAISGRELELAHKEYLQAKNQKNHLLKELETTEFTAPFDGQIGVFHFTPGMSLKSGDYLVSIYDNQKLFVRCDLPDHIAYFIKVGSQAMIEKTKYKIAFTQNMIDPISLLSPVVIDTPGLTKTIGSEVFIDLILKEKTNVLTIPKESLFIRDHKKYVYVIKNNQTVLTEITLGDQQKNRFEIVKGLKSGDKIVKKGVSRLFNGEKVKIL